MAAPALGKNSYGANLWGIGERGARVGLMQTDRSGRVSWFPRILRLTVMVMGLALREAYTTAEGNKSQRGENGVGGEWMARLQKVFGGFEAEHGPRAAGGDSSRRVDAALRSLNGTRRCRGGRTDSFHRELAEAQAMTQTEAVRCDERTKMRSRPCIIRAASWIDPRDRPCRHRLATDAIFSAADDEELEASVAWPPERR